MKKKTKNALFIAAAGVVSVAVVLFSFHYYKLNKKIQPLPTVNISETGIDIFDGSVTLIAHKGLSALAPENTLKAIEKAGREGFTAVEIDVCETLDGVWILSQDDTLNRMTDSRGKIKNHSLYELLNFTIDNGANIEEYPNEKITTLKQAINLCAQYGIKPYIDIRQSSSEGLKKIVQSLEEIDIAKNSAVLSRDMEILREVKTLSPVIELWHAADKLTDKIIDQYILNPGICVSFNANQIYNTEEKITQLLEKGIKLSCRTINDTETLKRLNTIGVKLFITDCILPR